MAELIDQLIDALGAAEIDDDGTFICATEPMYDRDEISVEFSNGKLCVLRVVHTDGF